MPIKKIHLPSQAEQELIRQELARFQDIPGALNIEQADGYFTALNLSPVDYDISDWLECLWGGGDLPVGGIFFHSSDILQCFSTMIQHWKNVDTRLRKDNLFLPLAFLKRPDGSYWAQGFLLGIRLYRDEWQRYCDKTEHSFEKILSSQAYLHHRNKRLQPQQEINILNQRLIIAINQFRQEYPPKEQPKRNLKKQR
ncbi:UPF0149 family protein [Pseudoteredinibacter isoporae]|uniref:UPF0149 family protein n=1 Tax=Pseudoteredinibacter isoporae TaxID=570281 RepID=UPI003109D156